jgi:hypothetical protein
MPMHPKDKQRLELAAVAVILVLIGVIASRYLF